MQQQTWVDSNIFINLSHSCYTCMSFNLKTLPMIAQPASERALWPQRTTVSPSQRRWPPTAGMRHCEWHWKAEGRKLRALNTQPRTRTLPPPVNTHTEYSWWSHSFFWSNVLKLLMSLSVVQLISTYWHMTFVGASIQIVGLGFSSYNDGIMHTWQPVKLSP